ncbi:MAG TPA: ATP-dependent zinc metalloprotease FtsH [Dehalococcoidia bacterium]
MRGEPRDEGRTSWGAVLPWLLLLGGLVVAGALLLAYCQAPAQGAEVPYSVFKDQLRAGNVESVTIRGGEIDGRFREPVDVPAGQGAPEASFTTHVPSFGDDELLPLLQEQGVTVNVEEEAGGVPWLTILLLLAPAVLVIGVLLFFRGGAGAQDRGQQIMSQVGRSGARRYSGARTNVGFDDVQGTDEAKRELTQVVQFLREPSRFLALGAKMPRGILLVGPPGTGKTLLARAVAGEAGVPFFSISGSEFMEVFVGVGASRVRDLFRQAKEAAPSIIFLDEIDAVGRQRGAGFGGGHDEREQTLNQLLAEMDGFEARDAVVVLAATNRPDVLDPALVRPGRFDRRVVVDLPDRRGREAILRVHARKVPLADDVDLGAVARATPGFAGADLANLVNEAAILAAQEGARRVAAAHFARARERILLGPRRPLLLSEDQRRLVAYHEAGHALVAHLLPNTDPVEVVTIVPHSQALGVTQQVPEEDRYNYAKPALEDRLTVMLGGRAAEELAVGQRTTGAENDLKEATRLARRMVVNWGMSDRVGPVAFESGTEHPFLGREVQQPREYGEELADLVDAEVRSMVEHAERRAVEVLTRNREGLERLAGVLEEEETVSRARMEEVLGGRAAGQGASGSRPPS